MFRWPHFKTNFIIASSIDCILNCHNSNIDRKRQIWSRVLAYQTLGYIFPVGLYYVLGLKLRGAKISVSKWKRVSLRMILEPWLWQAFSRHMFMFIKCLLSFLNDYNQDSSILDTSYHTRSILWSSSKKKSGIQDWKLELLPQIGFLSHLNNKNMYSAQKVAILLNVSQHKHEPHICFYVQRRLSQIDSIF